MVWRSIRAGSHRKPEYIKDEYVACLPEMLDGLTPLNVANRLMLLEEVGRTSVVINEIGFSEIKGSINGFRKSSPGLDGIDNHMIRSGRQSTKRFLMTSSKDV